jgi:hypothetical protein
MWWVNAVNAPLLASLASIEITATITAIMTQILTAHQLLATVLVIPTYLITNPIALFAHSNVLHASTLQITYHVYHAKPHK